MAGVAHAEKDENASGQRNVPRMPAQPYTGEKDRRKGDADATGATTEGEGESGYVPGYVPTSDDLRLREVYGDWVHGNPGTHLDGGITDDGKWQGCWRDLAVTPAQRYEAPSGKVGRRFVNVLVKDLRGVLDRRALWSTTV